MAYVFRNLAVKLLPADDSIGEDCQPCTDVPCTHGDSACLPCTSLCTGCTAGCTDTGCGCTDTICGPCTCTGRTEVPIVSEIPFADSGGFADELAAHKARLQDALAKVEETEYRLGLGGKPGTLEELDDLRMRLEGAIGELDEHRKNLEAGEGQASGPQ